VEYKRTVSVTNTIRLASFFVVMGPSVSDEQDSVLLITSLSIFIFSGAVAGAVDLATGHSSGDFVQTQSLVC